MQEGEGGGAEWPPPAGAAVPWEETRELTGLGGTTTGAPAGARREVGTPQVAPLGGKRWNSFLAMIRANTDSKEFVYLTADGGDGAIYNPYNLRIVRHSEMNPARFYTMSAAGVTQFFDGQSEFTPLGQWEREHHIFNMIITLNVFRKFRTWKGFTTWKRYIRQKKLRYCRERLELHLFYLNPTFQRSLLEIRRECHAVETLCMHDLKRGELYTLPAFVEAQKRQSETVRESLAHFSSKTSTLVMHACSEALELMEQQLQGTDALRDQAAGAASGPAVKMTGKDEAEEFSYAITAARRSEQRKLLNFIRLVDYMVCDTLHLLLSNSISGMLDVLRYEEGSTLPSVATASAVEALKAPAAANDGADGAAGDDLPESSARPAVFKVEIIVTDDRGAHLLYQPSAEDFQAEVTKVIGGFLQVMESVMRLLANPEVIQYVDSIEVDAGSPISELILDEQHDELVKEVNNSLNLAFRDAETFKETFQPFREMYLVNKRVSSGGMEQQYLDGTRTLENFREDIEKYQGQLEMIENQQICHDLGIVRVDSEKLQATLLPSPKGCMDEISGLLPRLANQRYHNFITDVHQSISKLSSSPTTAEDFKEFLDFLAETQEKNADYDARYMDVVAHYELMDKFTIKVPDIEYAAYQTLSMDFNSFKSSLEVAGASRDDNVTQLAGLLESKHQELHKAVVNIRLSAQDEMIFDENGDMDTVLKFTNSLLERVNVEKGNMQSILEYQRRFNITEATFDELEDCVTEVELKHSLWQATKSWGTLLAEWMQTRFEDLKVKDIEDTVAQFNKTAMKLERGLVSNKVTENIKEQIMDFKNIFPIIQNLHNEDMKERHWTKIQEELGKEIVRDEAFTLKALLDYQVMDMKDRIVAISTEATQEAALEGMLKKVADKWSVIEFTVLPFKESKDVFILGSVEEVVSVLEESMVTMATITASRFVAGIRTEVEKMEKSLRLFSDMLDEWTEVQKQWMYLESIFSAPDIQRQLPNESKAFFAVDKSFKEIMRRTRDRNNALQAGTTPGWLEMFQKSNETLEKVQKNLEDYLETKRMAFPRFYFLSNDELLEILSQTKNVQAVQPHMAKCFDGIRRLDFGKDPKSIDIFGMVSPEGEYVGLGKNLKARGNVEQWLTSVEQSMQVSLKRLAKKAYQDYPESKRTDWIFAQPAQVVLAVSQIYWIRVTEQYLAPASSDPAGDLGTWYEKNCSMLTDLTEIVRQDLNKLQRKIAGALITIDVHSRDIIEILINKKAHSISDFDWQMQLRQYWEQNTDDVVLKQVNATFVYGYEYLGAQSRLVVTPMTDRCYMTLTGALHLKLGGAPAGPAGTGKTETTKDLGKALGMQCIVFNCGDNLDYKFMGKFFSGLAQCGAWACFDEFNRIDIEVLSVVAQQLLTIQNALKASVTKFHFEGREIRLIDTFGVFITMNPGYAGRTELPDNLKALFRPMAMMIPDYALVAEVMLFSEGFEDAKTLSRKMTKLYKLASEQLSQQDHYDFGMRALKSVLVMAGSLKRANPNQNEDITLIRAMKDSNIPKFLSEDEILFNAIVGDLFPGVEVPAQDFGDLKVAIEECTLRANLQKHPDFVLKVIQLFETFNVRFGVMLVGPTGSGKSEIYRMLQAAMTQLREQDNANSAFQVTHTYPLNPKCIKMGELYGEYDLMTNEWTDGLGSTLIRHATNSTTDDKKWVVFDGPVDAIWIENMNTVLDDNCTLCLPNGERIKLNPVTMRMLFEVQDLAVASPATVSRCGMVYVPFDKIGWRPSVKSWLQALGGVLSDEDRKVVLQEEVFNHILYLFDTYCDPGLNFVRGKAKELVATVDINLVTSVAKYFEALVANRGLDLSKPLAEIQTDIDPLFAFSYMWGIGGSIDVSCWEEFNDFVRETLETVVNIPGGNCLDYFVNPKGELVNWSTMVPAFEFKDSTPYFELFVPTLDSTRYSFLMEMAISRGISVLFTGHSGVGKTAIVQNMSNRVAEERSLLPIFVNFSAQTTALDTQLLIESKLEKKRKTKLGAPPGKKFVVFVDDVNMPACEKYGAQPPVELLRQFMDFKGFYDRKKLFWKDVEDLTLTAACAPPGGGRQEVTPRFVRHFRQLCIPQPQDSVMQKIFQSIIDGFLTGFSPEFGRMGKPMVESTIEIFNRISQELLPTPAKSHYTFNLRDISKVFQGILLIKARNCEDKDCMVRLWIHENMRVFHDRLINDEDKMYFKVMVHELAQKRLECQYNFEETFVDRKILFGDYLKMGASGEDRFYQEVTDLKKLNKLLEGYLDEYNMNSKSKMNLVFFMDAIEHVSRLARILRQPRGNAMLVGVGGSGKQSVTKFACFMTEYRCFQIELCKGYGGAEFREDLKSLYNIAGIEGKPVTFLFTDNQIVEEGFVEDVNNMLNSGEVPGLYPPDEKDRVIMAMRDYCEKNELSTTRDGMYSAFINRVRDNLHIVLCMSPVGEAFRARCRQFPSLINCATIDWYTEWPEEALQSVAQHFLSEVDLGGEEVNKAIGDMCVEIHTSVSKMSDRFFQELRRKYYTTPKSYLDLINMYIDLLAVKREESAEARDRLVNGLNKLKETNSVVDTMKDELNKLQPILKEKSEATAKLLVEVQKDQEEAEKVKVLVSAEEAEVKEKTASTQVIKEDAERDLAEVLPAMQAATKALNALNKNDITEMKSFKTPPTLVQMTMEVVCLLLGEKTDWDSAKKVMGASGFIERLVKYDKDNIPEKIIKKVKPYIVDEQFQPDTVAKQSSAAKSLCLWCRAMDTYAKVAKVVEPKKQALRQAEESLGQMQAQLAEKQAQLQAVVDKVEALQKQLKDTQDEQASLQEQVTVSEQRLGRAGKLTSALGDEAVRWQETADSISESMVLLVGDIFLSSASVSYVGAFTGPYRSELMKAWIEKCQELEIPVSSNVRLETTLASAVEVREWNVQGLPTDSVSIDNAILVTRGKRWPLMIDPQGQANKWIKSMEAKNGLRTLKLTDSTLLRTLENSIRIGNPVILEDIGEEIDPALEPILQKQVFKQGNRLMIRVGDSDIDYDPNFKFYITTKLPNPHYLPEICIKVTLINFTVTFKGLEDQLLGDVVRKERPDLEEQKDRLVVSISNDKRQLRDLEDKILKLLKESKGNILDDEVLINTLNNSKLTSSVIEGRVKEAEETEKHINEAREGYRPVPTRGSILYFVIADLALVDGMYQYSLAYFTTLFNHCIESSEKSDDLETRLRNIMDYTTYFVYLMVCRGLFERHKLTFSFLMCTSILRNGGTIPMPEWNYLLRGSGGILYEGAKNPDPSWITSKMWEDLKALQNAVPGFEGLLDSLDDDGKEWKGIVTVSEPQKFNFPGGWDQRMSSFQKLLILRVFREEKLIFAFQDYVSEILGGRFTENPPLKLEEVYKDTTCKTPIIFILSTGADPTSMLQRFGSQMDRVAGERLHIISLGQGQGPIAQMTITQALKTGDWVCLQNCHLAKSWMLSLEQIVEGLQTNKDIDPEFRLWLTSMPAEHFPVPVLQNGIKITMEPPKGVRANIQRSYADLSEGYLETCEKGAAFKKLVFSCSFFHAVIQERRKFGPLGWNKAYDFSNSDLETSLMTLRNFLNEQEQIPWSAMVYVTGMINYGGRVTDDLDRRLLMSILRKYYTHEVLDDSYKFTESGVYRAPLEGDFESYASYIRNLPLAEGPDVFGMHENADIAFQLQETRTILDCILAIQPRLSNSGGGQSTDEIVAEQAKKIEEEMRPALDIAKAVETYSQIKIGSMTSSLGTVLIQESERFNKLHVALKKTLVQLQKAIQGVVVMSGELENMFNSILNNQVPSLWQSAAYPSLKPLASWVKDYFRRMDFFISWIENGEPNSYWMPGFFFPQGFLTGALQNHARKTQIAIDRLNFGFEVTGMFETEQATESPDVGLYVDGLFLDCGRWDAEKKYLDMALPGQMFSSLPLIHFKPIENYVPPEDQYQCPLYKTWVRQGVLNTTGQSTNYVLNLSLPIVPTTTPDSWILQGVAALCALND